MNDDPSGTDAVATVVADLFQAPTPLPGTWEAWLHGSLHAIGQHAYLLVFLGSFLENTVILGFILPGGVAVAVASAAGREADASVVLLFVFGAAGMAGGAAFDYFLGRLGAERVLLSPRLGRIGPYLLRKLDDAKPLLAKHGWWMMLVVHAFGHGRSSLALAAGASRLPFSRFMAMEIPAAVLWAGAFVGGGYFLGGEWRLVTRAMARLGWVGAGIAIAAAVWWWFRRRRAQATGAGDAGDETDRVGVRVEFQPGPAAVAVTPGTPSVRHELGIRSDA